MTTDTENVPADPAPGTIHFRSSMAIRFSEHESRVMVRGETVELTPEMIELSRDRNGATSFSLLDDEPAQVRRWGKVIFARGECPEAVQWWNSPDSTGDRKYARDLAFQEAELIRDPVAKYEAHKAIREKFGRISTNTIESYR